MCFLKYLSPFFNHAPLLWNGMELEGLDFRRLSIKKDNKQAGAELCQAQVKLEALDEVVVEDFRLWVTIHGMVGDHSLDGGLPSMAVVTWS